MAVTRILANPRRCNCVYFIGHVTKSIIIILVKINFDHGLHIISVKTSLVKSMYNFF